MDKTGPLTIRKDVPQPSIERSIADATRTFFANPLTNVVMDHQVALTFSQKYQFRTIADCTNPNPGCVNGSGP